MPDIARDIAETLLDTTADALLSGDFDAFAACFSLPHTLETFDGAVVLATRDDLRARFDNVRTYFRSNHVTDIVRHVMEASWIDDASFQYSHQTRLLAGSVLVQAPYPCISVVRHHDDHWKVSSSQYAIADAPPHNTALLGASNPSQQETAND